MSAPELEGTLILEALAEIGQLEAYADAVDADDLQAVTRLLRLAGIDAETIALVVEAISEA